MPVLPAILPPHNPHRRAVLLLLDISALALLVAALQSRGHFSLARAQVQVNPALPTQTLSDPPNLPEALPAVSPSPLPPTPTAAATHPIGPAAPPSQLPAGLEAPAASAGAVFLSLEESGRSRLFAYQPQGLPLTRLTAGDWDDLAPAASPDGSRLAFVSNRDGPWDLYLLELTSGAVTRLTDTPAWEGAPSWSPDGRWLAYEADLGEGLGGLEIYLRALPGENEPAPEPVRLTIDPATDSSPTWSPGGRLIAFVSDRSGQAEIWLADLDKVEDRFQNLSRSPQAQEHHPAWSPDGSALAWSTEAGGYRSLVVWSPDASQPPQMAGSGDWPVWSPDGGQLITFLTMPNSAYLSGYAMRDGDGSAPVSAGLAMPPVALAGTPTGLTWGAASLPNPLPGAFVQAAVQVSAPAWQPALSAAPEIPGGRRDLAPLPDVSAPFALLQDRVDEAFNALRLETARRAGWDFLASLENAYLPLTAPLFPGMGQDWLYTGRAFAFNPSPLHAGWVAVLREDYGAETYWRVFLRARFQDGTQGRPLPGLPWDLAARAGGDPRAYEQGGALAAIVPGGYWIDFTALAAAYGWERLPALTAWRSAYGAARYNEFVLTDGLDWASAMLELYPPEALLTPTAIFPPTHAPTPLPPSTHTPTAAPLIPTPLPTATPAGSTATAEPPPAAPTAPP